MPGYDSIEGEPWSEGERLHERRLPAQLEYLAAESDYYQDRFQEWGVDPTSITTLEEFAELPFTTKEDERAAQADPGAEQPLGRHQAVSTEQLNRIISSSGTTGKPTYFGLTRADREHWNTVLKRFFHATGIQPTDTVIFGVGQTMVPGGVPYFEGLTQLGANVVPAGGGSTERLLGAIEDLDPEVFFSTVSHGRYLIDRAPAVLGRPLEEFSIETVVLGGEPGLGTPAIREEIGDGWGATTVRECMGLGDVIAGIWAECEEEAGMHYVGQGHAHVELIDPDTGDVLDWASDAEGELVYTPLGREATPLLRFRSGDHARVTGTDCACGRTAPRIRVIGRTDDMLIYKGMNVFPSAIRDVVASVAGATPRVQVVVPDADTVRFEDPIPIAVSADPGSSRDPVDLAEAIESAVRRRLQVRVTPEVVDPDALGLSQYKSDLVRTVQD
jgi:phenylacetate-CoA ligase/benzoylacetate-CoA ligase